MNIAKVNIITFVLLVLSIIGYGFQLRATLNWKHRYEIERSAHVAYHTDEWMPKIGDRVATVMQLDGRVGDLRILTLTNVVRMGNRYSQTGVLVYGDGLPGVDSSWVKPAP